MNTCFLLLLCTSNDDNNNNNINKLQGLESQFYCCRITPELHASSFHLLTLTCEKVCTHAVRESAATLVGKDMKEVLLVDGLEAYFQKFNSIETHC